MTIRGHFMLSVAKVVELLALENGTTNQNGRAGVPKVSPSLFLAVGIDDVVELLILKSE